MIETMLIIFVILIIIITITSIIVFPIISIWYILKMKKIKRNIPENFLKGGNENGEKEIDRGEEGYKREFRRGQGNGRKKNYYPTPPRRAEQLSNKGTFENNRELENEYFESDVDNEQKFRKNREDINKEWENL